MFRNGILPIRAPLPLLLKPDPRPSRRFVSPQNPHILRKLTFSPARKEQGSGYVLTPPYRRPPIRRRCSRGMRCTFSTWPSLRTTAGLMFKQLNWALKMLTLMWKSIASFCGRPCLSRPPNGLNLTTGSSDPPCPSDFQDLRQRLIGVD